MQTEIHMGRGNTTELRRRIHQQDNLTEGLPTLAQFILSCQCVRTANPDHMNSSESSTEVSEACFCRHARLTKEGTAS